MLREQNSIEEIIIGIDLTTEEWRQAAVLGNPIIKSNAARIVRLATQDRTSRNTAMAIAQSIDYKIHRHLSLLPLPKSFIYSFPEPIRIVNSPRRNLHSRYRMSHWLR